MSEKVNSALVERQRILSEYHRRKQVIVSDLYAPWRSSAAFLSQGPRRAAASMLYDAAAFPSATSTCLEIGFGPMGWLADLIAWGVPEENLYGIELETSRVREVQRILPLANLLVGDATCLPWPDSTFDLVITSTVFTSILSSDVRQMAAKEISRVIVPGGALLWHDFAFNNPRNPNVRGIKRPEIKELFPEMSGRIRSVTLAPPIARRVVPFSWSLATILEALPFLRTHLLGVLQKPGR